MKYATCCRVMEINPYEIRYLRLAGLSRADSHVMERNIRQIGEPVAAVATRFELPPNLQEIRLDPAAAGPDALASDALHKSRRRGNAREAEVG